MGLGPKSRLLLEFLLNTGIDVLALGAHPTRALFAGGCTYDHALRRQVERMEANGLLKREEALARSKWVVTVTKLGRDEATDEIDPEVAWSRSWDGEWRILLFDLPTEARGPRQELTAWLQKRRFGGLQGSAWISPTFPDSWNAEIAKMRASPSAISFIQGKSFGRSSDADFVTEAWKFGAINAHYTAYLDFVRSHKPELSQEWLESESRLWRSAFELDPYLPNQLLPRPYHGKSALAARKQAYATLSDLFRASL